jgi:hypothetical protein
MNMKNSSMDSGPPAFAKASCSNVQPRSRLLPHQTQSNRRANFLCVVAPSRLCVEIPRRKIEIAQVVDFQDYSGYFPLIPKTRSNPNGGPDSTTARRLSKHGS